MLIQDKAAMRRRGQSLLMVCHALQEAEERRSNRNRKSKERDPCGCRRRRLPTERRESGNIGGFLRMFTTCGLVRRTNRSPHVGLKIGKWFADTMGCANGLSARARAEKNQYWPLSY